MRTRPDFLLCNYGTFISLMPATPAAIEWVAHNIPAHAQRHGLAVTIEPRYFANIADGILDAGLTIHGSEHHGQ